MTVFIVTQVMIYMMAGLIKKVIGGMPGTTVMLLSMAVIRRVTPSVAH